MAMLRMPGFIGRAFLKERAPKESALGGAWAGPGGRLPTMSPRGIAAEAAFESRLDALDRAFGSNGPESGIDEAERSLQAIPPAAAPVEAIPDERFETPAERILPFPSAPRSAPAPVTDVAPPAQPVTPAAPVPAAAPPVLASALVPSRASAHRALLVDSFRALLAAEQAARVTAGGPPVVSGPIGLTMSANTAGWLRRTASSAPVRFEVLVEPRAKGKVRSQA